MKSDEFIKFVQQATVLGAERQKELIENAGWMTDTDRAFLVQQINEAQSKIDKNNQQILEELTKVEEAIASFKKDELPKLVKAEEKGEKKGEDEAAEQLLKVL